ncbi:MAG: hypothetical protein ABIO70_27830 [Pseudomonadota bacterium]
MSARLATLWLLLAGARAEPAPPEAPSPFAAHPAHCHADLLVDVGAAPGDAGGGWLAIGPRLPGALLLVPGLMASEDPSGLAALVAGGAQLGLASEPLSHRGRLDGRSLLAQARANRRALRRATGTSVDAATMAGDAPLQEAVLAVLGLVLLLPPGDLVLGPPRFARGTQGTLATSVVLPATAFSGPQGGVPDAALAASLDAAARALEAGEVPVVRLALDGPALAAGDIDLLERWRREVADPCGARLLPPREASRTLRAWLQRGGAQRLAAAGGAGPEAPPPASSRRLEAAEVIEAAAALSCGRSGGDVLPRSLPPGLDLTDAFQAFTLLLALGEGPVTLRPLRPPQSSPRSVLGAQGATLPAAAVRAAAADLAPGLRDQIPAFHRVGDTALTAAELLCAMGRVLQGEDPVTLTGVFSPDPFAAGLGWSQPNGPTYLRGSKE